MHVCTRAWISGLWTNKGLGVSGGQRKWAQPPLGFAPNPILCRWVASNLSNINCSTCTLGYETTDASNTTCVQPKFQPYSGWEGSPDQALLRLRGIDNATIRVDMDTAMPVLLTEHTYTIRAPKLEPKERKFAGYAQPFLKIRYELDFSRGAEVDIGCGTTVVGDGSVDKSVPTDQAGLAHPLSMHEFGYQWPVRRRNLDATPPDCGVFPQRCPRYHRFKVTRAGNLTFVRAAAC